MDIIDMTGFKIIRTTKKKKKNVRDNRDRYK